MQRGPETARHAGEFRREAVDCVLASGGPITGCARELGVKDKTLNDRAPKFRRRGEATGARTPEEAGVAAPKRENGLLGKGNELLKKASALFAARQQLQRSTSRWRRGRPLST